jgi:hypothetical protein
MSFVTWLAAEPLWLSALIVVVIPTGLAMLGPVLIRRFVVLDRLTTNNEVAGFKFAVVGVIYAVLLGFAVIVVWEKFHDAEGSVAQEAGAALTLYRLADGLGTAPGQPGDAFRTALVTYVNDSIARDWPAMWYGRNSKAVTAEVSQLYKVVLADHAEIAAPSLQSEILYQLDQLTQGRRARLVAAEGVVPGVVLVVLVVGAIATVGFTFFFGTINLGAQVLMTGIVALTIFMGLHVIIVVNKPFTGPVSVASTPLRDVLLEFDRMP